MVTRFQPLVAGLLVASLAGCSANGGTNASPPAPTIHPIPSRPAAPVVRFAEQMGREGSEVNSFVLSVLIRGDTGDASLLLWPSLRIESLGDITAGCPPAPFGGLLADDLVAALDALHPDAATPILQQQPKRGEFAGWVSWRVAVPEPGCEAHYTAEVSVDALLIGGTSSFYLTRDFAFNEKGPVRP